jgi:hypothetical protein
MALLLKGGGHEPSPPGGVEGGSDAGLLVVGEGRSTAHDRRHGRGQVALLGKARRSSGVMAAKAAGRHCDRPRPAERVSGARVLLGGFRVTSREDGEIGGPPIRITRRPSRAVSALPCQVKSTPGDRRPDVA